MGALSGSVAMIALVFLFLAPSRAHAVMFSVSGAALYSDPVARGLPGGDPYRGRLGYGGGMMVEFPLAPWLGVETGGFYLQKKFFDGTRSLISSVAEVPLTLRIWLGFKWSIGIGGYVASFLGNLKSNAGQEFTYSAYGWKTMDFGGVGSLRYDFGGPAFVGVFIESRYTFGWRNLSTQTTGTEIKQRDVQGLVGVRFGG